MISFSQPTLKLANKIREHVSLEGIIPLSQSKSAFVTTQTPLNLLSSASAAAPRSFGLVFIDAPRATTRSDVSLLTTNNAESVVTKDFSLIDHDYRFHLAANLLAIARFSKLCIEPEGVVAVTTNSDMSTIVRGAFEMIFGYDGLVGELVYQTRTGGGNDSSHLSVDHETLLIYSVDPRKVPRLMISKPENELKKYNQEDQKGKFYWDTYIRKQARNYYPIECPDGSILELDNDGNRISWLWREQTFKEKLDAREIKFRKVEEEWRLYYKDRIKELKILRSIVLQKDHLADIIESYPQEDYGSELLTNKGSSEVRAYSRKPDYLKSSAYYNFIFNTFAKEASRVLVPFPEYGSAVLGLDSSVSKSRIYTSVSDEWSELFKKRTNDLSNNVVISTEAPINPLDALNSLDENVALNFFSELVSVRKNVEEEFYEYKHDKNLIIRYALDSNRLFAISVSEDTSMEDGLKGLIAALFGRSKFNSVEVYTQTDVDRSFAESLGVPVNIHGIPEDFIS